MSLKFRCYAYGSGENWEAICVDLDIAVFGDSANEVEETLDRCIRTYLETVADFSPEERRRFLTRKSPWFVRFKLALRTCLYGFRGDSDRPRVFTLRSQVPALFFVTSLRARQADQHH